MRLDDARLLDCLDLLLGAAWADGVPGPAERDGLERLSAELGGGDVLTAEARRYFDAFEAGRFEPTIACARLGLGPGRDALREQRRRAFLTLIGRVVDADGVLEPEEEAYVSRLTEQIGATQADLEAVLDDIAEVAGLLGAPPTRDAHAGRVLGKRYELARGRNGGFDGRYVAYDRPLGARRVEIRRLNAHVPAADAPRLLREAVAVAATGSPHVVSVYDVGGINEGTPFLVTEPLRGETLRARLNRKGKLDPLDALRIADRMLAGLEAAHGAGVVHRALTADDVFLVTTLGVEDHVKLTGFGTTRLHHLEPSAGKPLLGMGTAVAPERLGGAEVHEQADLFSAAVILFEMLAGHPPYGDGPPSLLAVRRSRATEPPALASVDPVFDVLDAVIAPNLMLDPDERMSDASEFRAALEEVVEAL